MPSVRIGHGRPWRAGWPADDGPASTDDGPSTTDDVSTPDSIPTGASIPAMTARPGRGFARDWSRPGRRWPSSQTTTQSAPATATDTTTSTAVTSTSDSSTTTPVPDPTAASAAPMRRLRPLRRRPRRRRLLRTRRPPPTRPRPARQRPLPILAQRARRPPPETPKGPQSRPFRIPVAGAGFEPAKAEPMRLQRIPFDRSGTPPGPHTRGRVRIATPHRRVAPEAGRTRFRSARTSALRGRCAFPPPTSEAGMNQRRPSPTTTNR